MSTLAKRWNAAGDGMRRLLVTAVIAAATVLLSALIFATGPERTPTPPQEKAWPVSTMLAQVQAVTPTFTGYGRVQSRAQAKLTSDISATVAGVHASEGDVVQAGDLLVQLDAAQYRLTVTERQAALAQHQANLASVESELALAQATDAQHESMQRIAQAKLARHRELMRDRLISQSLLDEVVRSTSEVDIDYQRHKQQLAQLPHRIAAARAEVNRAEALLQSARIDLAKTELRAPFSGPVIAVNAAVGDRMLPGSVLVEMADSQAFELRVSIPDAYVQQIRAALTSGQPVSGTSDLGVTALARLSSSVAPGQAGVDGFFTIADAANVHPAVGQVIEINVQLPQLHDVLALPPQALYENRRIYAVVEQRLQPIQVQRVGEARDPDGNYRVLVSSRQLSTRDEIVTTQLPGAMAGLLVEPNRSPATVVSKRALTEPPPAPQDAQPALMRQGDDAYEANGFEGDGQAEGSKRSSLAYPRMV